MNCTRPERGEVSTLAGDGEVGRLTRRERQVLEGIAAGLPLGDIAERLHLSPKTVSTHKMRLMEKLGIDNNAELVRYALRHGLGMDGFHQRGLAHPTRSPKQGVVRRMAARELQRIGQQRVLGAVDADQLHQIDPGHGLDRLRGRQKAGGPRPMAGPARSRIGRYRRDTTDRSLRNISKSTALPNASN